MGNACSVHGETRNAYRVLGGGGLEEPERSRGK
jgi:hypothetical protein